MLRVIIIQFQHKKLVAVANYINCLCVVIDADGPSAVETYCSQDAVLLFIKVLDAIC